MKSWPLHLLAVVLFSTLGNAAPGKVEKMDISTTNYVITKLESVLATESDSKTKSGIYHRLGDLYAERSRLKLLKQVEGNCAECEGVTQDQKIALAHYYKALPSIWGAHRGEVLIQVAYLQTATGENNKAYDTLNRILKEGRKNHSDEILGLALTRLGDLFFSNQNFKRSVFYYKRALAWPATPRTGYVLHRKGWSELNTGDLAAAKNSLHEILTDPKHLDLDGDGLVDDSFHYDVSRDFTTFLARGSVGSREIHLVGELSPNRARIENLLFLARESERVGQRDSAIATWEFLFQSGEIGYEDQLEGYVRLFQIQIDKNRDGQAAAGAERVASFWDARKCKDQERCSELEKKFRNSITRWNKFEKGRVNGELLRAYAAYLSVFPKDMEMNYWAAQVAHHISNYAAGRKFYRATSLLAYQSKKEGRDNKTVSTLFEGSLLGEIETSEKLDNLDLKLDSYNHYLQLNPKGTKVGEVSYQKAYTLYLMKRYEEAAELFFKCAVQIAGLSSELKLSAADLALDSQKILKNDRALEVWALSLSKKFPERTAEYRQIARTSVLNQSKSVIDARKSKDYESMVNHLAGYDLSDAPLEDRLAFLRNRIVLAERLKRLDMVEKAASQMLTMKDIPQAESDFATLKLIWVAEMQLNFLQAYQLLKIHTDGKKPSAENEFRLAVLADLAGRSSRQHYSNFLRLAPRAKEANFVRAKIIKADKNPMNKMLQQRGDLIRDPEIFADLLEWYYVSFKPRDTRDLEKLLEDRRLRALPQVQGIGKDIFLKDFDKVAAQITRHRLQGSNDAILQRSVAQRVELLQKVSAFAERAIQSGDWTLQVVTLDVVQNQNARMYQDLAALPAPRGLSPEQKAQYQALLAQQAESFKATSLQAREKLVEMWKNHQVFSAFQRAYVQSEGHRRSLVKAEIERVKVLAPERIQLGFNRLLKHQHRKPTRNQIVAARMDLKKDPFSVGKARKLKKLNEQYGDDIFEAYMEGRIRNLSQAQGES